MCIYMYMCVYISLNCCRNSETLDGKIDCVFSCSDRRRKPDVGLETFSARFYSKKIEVKWNSTMTDNLTSSLSL